MGNLRSTCSALSCIVEISEDRLCYFLKWGQTDGQHVRNYSDQSRP